VWMLSDLPRCFVWMLSDLPYCFPTPKKPSRTIWTSKVAYIRVGGLVSSVRSADHERYDACHVGNCVHLYKVFLNLFE
jgi:hypothetical protein